MTTRRIFDLTDPTCYKTLDELLSAGEPFAVMALHPGGYAVLAFTARCEKQKDRHAVRWHGYKKSQGRLRKAYIGRLGDITPALLQSVASRLLTEA